MQLLPSTADDLIKTYRTFGAEGPAYQVVSKRDGNTVRVRVLESGEELDYPVQQALADREAE